MTVEVGPVAVKGKYTVARFHISTDSKEDVYLSQAFAQLENVGTTADVRMMSLEQSLVYVELGGNTEDLSGAVTKGAPKDAFPVFGALNDGVHSVEMLLPNMGVVVGVPVVKEAEVDFNVDDVIAKANLQGPDPGPFKLERATVSMDGSSDTKQDEKSTTVTVAGDVTFATDSDQLSAQADSVLASVVEQIKKYPSGGDLTITGHTDDVADDAHNQDLSERRAKAVSDRLKRLTDLSRWKESVSGKGESSPRVSNDSDEHRQANRRVEITLTPSKPAESSAPPSTGAAPSSTAMPKAAGPVGKGPEGVDVTIRDKVARMSIDSVTRVGKFLIGTVRIEAEQDVMMPAACLVLPESIESLGWEALQYDMFRFGAYSLTILDGGKRYLEAGFSFSDGRGSLLTNQFVYDLVAGGVLSMPAVWPDPGGDRVVVDLPDGNNPTAPHRIVARLTDIPVVNA